MKFDYTHGKPAKYGVHIYSWNTSDIYYFGTYKAAKEFFDKATATEREKGTTICLYNIHKDIRKEFVKK